MYIIIISYSLIATKYQSLKDIELLNREKKNSLILFKYCFIDVPTQHKIATQSLTLHEKEKSLTQLSKEKTNAMTEKSKDYETLNQVK